MGKIGPVTLDAPTNPETAPSEQRDYWPDTESLERRGRLKDLIVFASPGRALTTSYDYAALGIHLITDPNGLATLFVRDARGRVIRAAFPGGKTVEIRYYDGAKPRLELIGDGSVAGQTAWARLTTYDSKGRVATVSSWAGDPDVASPDAILGWTERREYDQAGNPVKTTLSDAAGVVRNERVRTYDPRHRPLTETHPVDITRSFTWTYALDGYLESIADEEARITEFLPDPMRRVRTVRRKGTSPSGAPLSQDLATYTYEPTLDAVLSVQDGAGRTTSYVYDDFGQLRSVANADTLKGGPVRFEHDGRGNVVRKIHARVTETFEYDGLDRLTRHTALNAADNQSIVYTYLYDEHADASPGGKGRLTRITEPDRSTSFFYDDAGQLRFEQVQEGAIAAPLVTEYRYDPSGLLDTVVYATGLQLKYERDPATRAVTEVRNLVTGTRYVSGVVHEPLGPLKALTFKNGLTLSQAFNRRYEPSNITVSSATTTVLDLAYAMSPAGEVKAISSGGATTGYGYDLIGRLTSFSLPPGATATALRYTYSGDRITGATDATTGTRLYAFGYDDQSNLSAVSTYDASGNAITATLCLRHDALSRLTLVGFAAPGAGGPDVLACRSDAEVLEPIARFQYDAANRRVSRRFNGRVDAARPRARRQPAPRGTSTASTSTPSACRVRSRMGTARWCGAPRRGRTGTSGRRRRSTRSPEGRW